MELSQRLRQARQEAGLSQKALCGDRITRNMLSQIENGSARPSMDTLRYLAQRLGKPLSYFLDEDTVTSPNQPLMEQLRTADPSEVLQLLNQYQDPDPTFDRERWLLEALACLQLAEAALRQKKPGYARTLLERAALTGSRTPYYTPELERRRLLLCFQAGIPANKLDSALPDPAPELLLRGKAALDRGELAHCKAYLEAVDRRTVQWHFLYGQMLLAGKEYAPARIAFEAAWDFAPIACCEALEICCRECEDFAGAYFYACKRRELG